MLKKKKTEDQELHDLPEEVSAEDTLTGDDTPETETETETPEVAAGPSAEDKLKDELAQANDKYLRLYAEFDNFRRRTREERTELLKTAGKEMVVAMLPVLDDFERAAKAMENSTDVNAVKEGVALVQHKIKNILGQKGLTEMEAVGQPFDADIHEAITSIPAPTDDMKGKVIDQMEKGYYLNDKVVRFAKVIVGA
ncbi:nucleotide exchange factor GrpE [Mucilaginibacter myungsuensis]|uniref:Protein GrpE n=2 Tax=Mucilaginibacter myungsuensis TaxID=649104 RepID=A0A929PWE3_9SPHI|nr:nucleotide exchange factor GrpE [Mucilaginibacter myungsuensis]MBE9662748.1 nucleotide exchange factor GrpE [Mucilaginibacter myungsuensis]